MTELEMIQKEKMLEQKRKEYELMRWSLAQKKLIKPSQAPQEPENQG